jgi:UDP-GlcNAc:undecaprenyl-phosphate/decaprenyl-phosphate GlcNAc-1-phosphate transferase
MLTTLLLLTVLSLVLSLLFTPTVRTLAIRMNYVDLPDNNRKVHKRPIPRVGGIAVGAAYFGSLLMVLAFLSYPSFSQHAELSASFGAFKSIAPAAAVIFFIGLADDIFNLKPWQKFAGQFVAAGMVVSGGVHIHQFAAFHVHPMLLTAVTVVWLVGCTNAVNLIDGLDGLAGGISLLATLTVLIAALINGDMGLAIAAAPLAGALIGFLVFNFNPASIFLGDSGSLLLGFLLGCYSVLWTGKSVTTLDMAAPFMVLVVPLLDTSMAITRRFLRGQPIFKADRSHIHHRLLGRGLSHRNTVLYLYAAAGIAGLLSLGLVWTRDHWQTLVFATFVCQVVIGIRELEYTEFDALRRVVFRGGVRREIIANLAVEAFEEKLEAAQTAEDCWEVIRSGCQEFGLQANRMQFAGHMFRVAGHNGLHSMRIAISANGWVELSHSSAGDYPAAIVPLANSMRRVLTDKSTHGTGVEARTAYFSTSLFEAAAASTAN